jgi:hypothetical protein
LPLYRGLKTRALRASTPEKAEKGEKVVTRHEYKRQAHL